MKVCNMKEKILDCYTKYKNQYWANLKSWVFNNEIFFKRMGEGMYKYVPDD